MKKAEEDAVVAGCTDAEHAVPSRRKVTYAQQQLVGHKEETKRTKQPHSVWPS